MSRRKRIRLLIISLLSTLLVLMSGVAAIADNGIDIKIDSRDVDVSTVGSNLIIEENQFVKKDAVAIGGSLIVSSQAKIRGDAISIGGDVTLKTGASIDGDVISIGGNVIREEGVNIDGDVVEVLSGAKALIDGTQSFVERFGVFGSFYLAYILLCLFGLAIVFIFGFFLLLLLPTHLQTISATIVQHPFKSGVWGLGGIVALNLLTGLITGSLLGLILIPSANLAFAIAVLLGCTATSVSIGRKIKSHGNPIQHFTIGVFIFATISLIPLAGGLIVLMVNLFGFGAVVLSKFGTIRMEIVENTYETSISQYPMAKN